MELYRGGVSGIAFLLDLQLEKAELRKEIHPSFDPEDVDGVMAGFHQLG